MAQLFDGQLVSSNLELAGGNYIGNFTLPATKVLNWTGGSFTGANTLNIANGAVLNVLGTAQVTVNGGYTLANAGTINWSSSNNINVQNGGVISNTGLFSAQSNQALVSAGGGASFINTGSFIKTSGGGSTDISIPVTSNAGTFTADTGELRFNSTNSFNSGTTFNGLTAIRVTNGATFSGAILASNLDLAGGSYVGTAVLSPSSVVNWTGGSGFTGVGTFTVGSNAVLNVAGPNQLTVNGGYNLVNEGTLNWTSTNNINLQNGGVISNSGLFSVQNNQALVSAGGGASFVNAGSFTKSIGTGSTSINIPFDNQSAGSINVQTGLVISNSNFTQSGAIVLALGTSLSKPGGLVNSGTVRGSGTLSVGAGNTLTNSGALAPGVGAGNTATLNFIGNLDLATGHVDIDVGGTSSGASDKIAVTGNVIVSGALNASLTNGYAPVNTDAVPFMTMSGTASGVFSSVSLPANFTTGYNLATGEAARLIYASSGTRTFNNSQNNLDWSTALNWTGGLPGAADAALISGSFAVSHASGADTVGALTIANSNSLSVSGGSLTVLGTTVLDGSLAVSGTGSAMLNGALNGASSGQVNLGAGSLTLGGASTLAGFTQTGGTLIGAGNVSIAGSFTHSAGTNNLTGRLEINQSGNLVLPAMTSLSSLLARASGDLTLGGNIATSGAGNSLVLATAGNFLNTGNRSLSAGSNTGADRWLVYSSSPAAIVKGGLTSSFRYYSTTYAAVAPGNISQAGNGFVYAAAPGTLTANTSLLSGTASHIYGDAPTASLGYLLAGFADAEDNAGNIGLSGSASFAIPSATSDVGNYSAAFVGGLSSGTGYSFTSGTAVAYSVTQRPLVLTLTGTKVYDKTSALATPIFGTTNSANGDALNISGVAGFTDSFNVGTLKPLSASSIVVTGTKAGNYSYATSLTGSGSITARPITVTGLTVSDKVYDGNTTATVTGTASFGNIIGGDIVSINGGIATANFADPNAGSGKPITLGGLSLAGADASNYQLTGTFNTTTGNITTRPLAVAADSKQMTYGDALPALTYTLTSGNLIGSDSFAGALATLGSSTTNIGNYAITQGSFNAGQNYAITFSDSVLAISQRPLGVTLSGSKVYDKTITLASPSFTLNNVANGDLLTVGATTIYTDNVNVGANKPLSASNVVISGAKVGNYSYPTTASGSGSITARPITLTGVTIADKVYDGTVAATLSGGATFGNVIVGDIVNVSSIGGTASFLDPNAGTNKSVTVGGMSLSGADSSNYSLSTTTFSSAANISQRPISVTANPLSKIYGDADPTKTFVVGGGGLVGGDTFSGSLSRVVGESVAGGPYSITQGTLAVGNNYTLTYFPADLSITPASLLIAANGQSRVYGDVNPALSFAASGFRFNDDIGSVLSGGLTSSATVTTDVGSYPITRGSLVANSNYRLSFTDNALQISARPLTVSFAPQSKIYDGNTSAPFIGFVIGNLANQETVGLVGTGSYDHRNVGTAKAISYTGLTLVGGSGKASNYSIATTATGSGTITQLGSVNWLSNVITGDWANASNWAGGALPDGSNVANVTLPAGVSVSFSGTTVATILTSLSGSGATLALQGGSLMTGNATLGSYNQSGGSFDAAGNMNIETNFIRSGGSFGVHGLLTINQSSGDLKLNTNSALNLGQIRVQSGNLQIDNSGSVTSSNTADVSASGNIEIIAHSPITVGAGGITAGNGITLNATTASADSTITTEGKLTGGSGLVSLTAYQSITQNANITGANIELTSQHGNITMASSALSTVPTGGNIRLLASLGDILTSASNLPAPYLRFVTVDSLRRATLACPQH
ncbi:MAG: hypothetical protein IPJ25_07855 [Rhodocyclaceae bacterium]|nr:hypothetical protein [Rhodocyclaceae bacterium]